MKRKHLFHRLLAGALSASVVLSAIPMQLTAAEEIVGAVTVDEAYEAEEMSFDAEQPADDAEEVFYEAEEPFFDEEEAEDTADDFAEEEIVADFDAEQDLALEEQFYEEEAFEAAAPEETDGEEAFALDELIEDPEGEEETTEAAEDDDASEKDLDGEEAEEMRKLLAEKLPVNFFRNAQTLALNTDYTVSIQEKGDYALYKFVPTESATYNFTSTSPEADVYDMDPIIIVYDANGESIADDDDSSTGYNFSLSVDLEANKTYYLRAAAYSSNSNTNFTFKAVKQIGWLNVNTTLYEYELEPGNSGRSLEAADIDASPAPSYAWYIGSTDEANRIAGANASTYATGPITHTSDYYLVVSNTAGSRTIHYILNVPSYLDVYYADGTSSYNSVDPGETISLGVSVSGSEGYTYQWYITVDEDKKDYVTADQYTVNDVTFNGSTTSDTLSLTVNKDTDRLIKCVVTDVYGAQGELAFSVECSTFSLYYQDRYSLYQGDDCTMYVDVWGLPYEVDVTYQWYDSNNNPLTTDPDSPEQYTVENVQASAKYRCDVTVGDVTKHADFTIVPINLEDVYAISDENIDLPQNQTATLQVGTDCEDPDQLTYTWAKYNNNSDEYEVIPDATEASLIIGPFTTGIEREYRCTVSDQYGTSYYTTFWVDVEGDDDDDDDYSDTFTLDHTEDINIIIHGTATMKVTPTGIFRAPVTYRWYLRPGDTVESYIKIMGQTTDTYVITDMLEEQRYQCEATDADGKKAVAYFNLTVDSSHTHNWKAGAVTRTATCTTPGTQIYTCTICAASKNESLPALGHSWGAWTTTSPATVNAAAVQTRTCSRCKQKETRSVGSKLTPAPTPAPTITPTPKPAPTMTLNVSGTLPMKKKQSAKVVKVSGLIAGDSIKTVTSSNPKLVKVSRKNNTLILKAQKKTGTATITITLASGLKKSFKVKVQKGKVKTKKITVASKNVSLNKKKSFNLATVLYPLTTQQKATYKTSNKKVATVSKKGVIKAKKKGKAKITVKSGSKKVTVKVTVK